MEVFNAVYFFMMQNQLIEIEKAIGGGNPKTFSRVADDIMEVIAILEDGGGQIELKRTHEQLDAIDEYLKSLETEPGLHTDEKLKHEMRFLRVCIERDLREHKMYIPTIQQAEYYQKPKLFGDMVYEKFESARNDILEAGNCYATDNFTACVFHLMRVAERGMIALAKHLKIQKIGKKPVEYVEWGIVSKHLAAKIAELQQKPRGPKKSELLKQYANAASHADYMNEMWRKDVAHAHNKQPYNGPEALSVLTRVGEFMQSVASFLR
jgi:hypothetical protein